MVTDVYAMKSEKQFINTLQDNVAQRGAMDKLVSDRGTNQISQRVLDYLRAFSIAPWQSEAGHQHQRWRWDFGG